MFICCIYIYQYPLENYLPNFQTAVNLFCSATLTSTLATTADLPPNYYSINFSRKFHLDQQITKSTRITETSQTIIDLILVNNSQRINPRDVIPCSLSDPPMEFCVFKAGEVSLKLRHGHLNTGLKNTRINNSS